MHDTNKAKK